jgi:uncharacterized lipoprotein YbaY
MSEIRIENPFDFEYHENPNAVRQFARVQLRCDIVIARRLTFYRYQTSQTSRSLKENNTNYYRASTPGSIRRQPPP